MFRRHTVWQYVISVAVLVTLTSFLFCLWRVEPFLFFCSCLFHVPLWCHYVSQMFKTFNVLVLRRLLFYNYIYLYSFLMITMVCVFIAMISCPHSGFFLQDSVSRVDFSASYLWLLVTFSSMIHPAILLSWIFFSA